MKNFSDKTLIVKVILLTSFLSLHTTTISLGTNAYNRTSDLISRSDPAYSRFSGALLQVSAETGS
ncbi:MAG: hypothetical protein R3A12_08110 [Ignavibacteria bacterium]